MTNRDMFTLAEISKASGVDTTTLKKRVEYLVREEKLKEGQKAFNYEEVKMLIRYRRTRGVDPVKVSMLKRQLIDDGLASKG